MSGRYLGVDMGGSGTRAHLIQDPASARDWVLGGGNLALDASAVLMILAPLVTDAGPDAACFGLPGARTAPAATEWLQDQLSGLVSRMLIMTDADLALMAAFGPTDPGIVVCAGTGSVAVVRASGLTHLVGGHGYLLDDAGGAYAIGRHVLVEALRGRDRGQRDFADLVENAIGASLDERVASVYRDTADREPLARLARVASSVDHPVARRILDVAADALVGLALAAQERFGPLPVRYAGGVFDIDVLAARLESAVGATRVSVRAEVAAAQYARVAA